MRGEKRMKKEESRATAAGNAPGAHPGRCDPMDCSLTGSSIHGIFQARVLEWGATAFSMHFGRRVLT